MIHRRWWYFIFGLLCAITAGLLFTFQQVIAGTCIILLTGITCIAFVTSPNDPEQPVNTRPQSTFVVMNPHIPPDSIAIEVQPPGYIERTQ